MSTLATSEGSLSQPNAHASEAPATIWPRISLVTPVFNSAKYIEQTIQSVLSQNYPNLEYFIIDGGSTDGTLDIIRQYESQITGWVSEPDNGMYDALNKGFARTTGEILGWISATDQYQVGGLSVVGSVFRDLPHVEWITGRPVLFSEEGMTVAVGDIPGWSRKRFLSGANRYIQQESTFWRRTLWERAGCRVDASRRIAADFELWVRFFRYAQLHSVDALIGGFRSHADSIGLQDMAACHRVHDQIIAAELDSQSGLRSIRRFRRLNKFFQSIPKLRWFWNRFVFSNLSRRNGSDLPPVIRYERNRWVCSPQ
jgi:glycosyltransferase involved in cell wall biosynthesis